MILKECVPFTNRVSKISIVLVNNAKDLGKLMSKENLLEYSDNYSKPLQR